MKKFIGNLKISSLISIMLVSALISTLLVGVIGFINLNKINKNVNSMYHNNLTPIVLLGDMRQNVLLMRISIVKDLWGSFDPTVSNQILSYENNVTDLEKSYEAINNPADSAYTDFKSAFGDYISTWNNIISGLSSGAAANDNDKNTMSSKATLLMDSINKLVSSNKQQASNMEISSRKIFSNSKYIFIIIGIFAFIILSIISITVLIMIKRSTDSFIKNLDIIATGDFTIAMDINRTNEFGLMKSSLGRTIDNISMLLNTIQKKTELLDDKSSSLSAISEEMASSSEEIANAVQDVAKGAMSQASELSDTSITMDNLSNEIDGIVKAISSMGVNSRTIDNKAKQSNERLLGLSVSIKDINGLFKNVNSKIVNLGTDIDQIHSISDLINSIAGQTNLLALNAAIEAARAGEAGKGFAVVADEIRKLAEQSKESSLKINTLIEKIYSETNNVVKTTDDVGSELSKQIVAVEDSIISFGDIVNAISDILPEIDNISSIADSLDIEKNSIKEKVDTLLAISEETSASSEEIAASSQEMNASSEEVAVTAQELATMTQEMIQQVSVFKIKG